MGLLEDNQEKSPTHKYISKNPHFCCFSSCLCFNRRVYQNVSKMHSLYAPITSTTIQRVTNNLFYENTNKRILSYVLSKPIDDTIDSERKFFPTYTTPLSIAS